MKDPSAKKIIIENILPKINKNSYIGNQFDSELYEYIVENICKDITEFKILSKN